MKQRKSIRLQTYDYTHPGMYFVTICTQDREMLFGDIVNAEMVLNGAGTMINKWWLKIPKRFSNTKLDEYIIMPNHIHGIIQIINDNPVGVDPRVDPNNNGRTHGSAPTVGAMMQWFKTMATNEYIRNVKTNNWEPFNKRLFQRNFYEHIIRANHDLEKIREYIHINPQMREG